MGMQRTFRTRLLPESETRGSPSRSTLEVTGPVARRGSCTWTVWVTTAGETEIERCGPRSAATSPQSLLGRADTTHPRGGSSAGRSETAEDPGMINNNNDDNDKVPGKLSYSPVFQVPGIGKTIHFRQLIS